jgi:DNA-directed RNA polymerase subunit RPC12/RpoP
LSEAKILFLDTETAPKRAFVWSLWKQNIGLNQLERDGYLLCYCYKWLGENNVHSDSIWEYTNYRKDPEDDYNVIYHAWKLLDEADIVVAHNAKGFDIPVLNARFVTHGFPPPSPYKIVDTLKIAKAKFRFTSNRLDALGMFLGEGRKIDTGGFDLWRRVMEHDEDAQTEMVDYCVQDVQLLENVYLRLRAWDSQHPNVALYNNDTRPVCNVCGSEHVHKKGFHYTKTQMYQRYRCTECGHQMRDTKNCTPKEKKENIRSSV